MPYQVHIRDILVHVVLQRFVVHLQVPALVLLHELEAPEQRADRLVEGLAYRRLH